ncbi:hypothetical protein [Micromonospora sonchi]|uniref:hypothetical protein n=1 Tax=Micromonospora sonchi TaxID=1763543 RepID=UPI00166C5317|nr:hypothetical protein [Micromonospora sonchi]
MRIAHDRANAAVRTASWSMNRAVERDATDTPSRNVVSVAASVSAVKVRSHARPRITASLVNLGKVVVANRLKLPAAEPNAASWMDCWNESSCGLRRPISLTSAFADGDNRANGSSTSKISPNASDTPMVATLSVPSDAAAPVSMPGSAAAPVAVAASSGGSSLRLPPAAAAPPATTAVPTATRRDQSSIAFADLVRSPAVLRDVLPSASCESRKRRVARSASVAPDT